MRNAEQISEQLNAMVADTVNPHYLGDDRHSAGNLSERLQLAIAEMREIEAEADRLAGVYRTARKQAEEDGW